MPCSKCGAEVVASAVYCHKCGARIVDPSAAPLAQRRTAGTDEEIDLWEGTYSPKALYAVWAFCALATVGALAAAALVALSLPAWGLILAALVALWLYPVGAAAYRRLNVHYRLTNQRFVHERGILRRETDEIEVIDIDDVSSVQNLAERLLGIGTIRLTSSDRTDPSFALPGIDDVAEVAALFDQARRTERTRRGLHIESV